MISFNTLESLFPEEEWDIGYLSKESLLRCALTPIKRKWNYVGEDFTNHTHFANCTNAIVLIKTGHTWDYTHYDDAKNIMQNSGLNGWYPVYTNYKEAAILSGLGVRAKNSLVYSYQFGFDCHITVIRFDDTIVDIPTNKRINYKMWSRCKGCSDCADACPVKAIHNEEEPFWLNSADCHEFMGKGVHPKIPSIASFLIKYVYINGNIPTQVPDDTKPETYISGNGFSYDGNVVRKNGKPVHIPFCRECTSQPRCSKWNGNYPYKEIEDTIND